MRNIPFKARLVQPVGSVRTYFEDSSNAARRSGLTVENMLAAIDYGDDISIQAQEFNSTNNELRYQLRFNTPGEAIVSITTTFANSQETIVDRYKAICLTIHGRRHPGGIRDYC